MVKKKGQSVPDGVEQAAFQGVQVDRKFIEDAIRRDVSLAYNVLRDVVNEPRCIDVLTDIYWERYKKIQKAKEVSPELPLEAPKVVE